MELSARLQKLAFGLGDCENRQSRRSAPISADSQIRKTSACKVFWRQLPQLTAHFGTDQIEEEDPTQQRLHQRGRQTHA